MAESVMVIFRTELHRNPSHSPPTAVRGKASTTPSIATCAWVSWFNEEQQHSELDDRTPADVEADYRQKSQPDAA